MAAIQPFFAQYFADQANRGNICICIRMLKGLETGLLLPIPLGTQNSLNSGWSAPPAALALIYFWGWLPQAHPARSMQ